MSTLPRLLIIGKLEQPDLKYLKEMKMFNIQSKKSKISNSRKIRATKATPVGLNLHNVIKQDNFNLKIYQKHQEVKTLLNFNENSNQQLLSESIDLEHVNETEFKCEREDSFSDSLSLYTKFMETRNCGWLRIFEIMLDLAQKNYFPLYNLTVLDFLGGNRTLEKKVKVLWKYCLPNVIEGVMRQDMYNYTHNQENIAFWRRDPFNYSSKESAECIILTFGMLHLYQEQLSDFVLGIRKALKPNGFCILHDCIEGFPTESCHPEIIMKYQPCAHPCNFITYKPLIKILKQQFNNFELRKIYDPFYFLGKKGQTQQSLKREFYAYLMSLYNLSKLHPENFDVKRLTEYEDEDYWKRIDEEFSPYFNIGNEHKVLERESINKALMYGYLNDVQVPLVNNLSFKNVSTDQYALIAPRVALVGIGIKEE